MIYTKKFDVYEFQWWSGACDTIGDIERAGRMDLLQSHLEDVFNSDEDTPSDTDINDYVWFERADIYSALGLDEDGNLPDEGKEFAERYDL